MARKTVHTIYGLYDPEDAAQEIRYVGYTHFSPEQRIIDHVAGAKKRADTHKKKWIRKLLRKGLRPAYRVLEITTARNWKQRETYWIKALREQGCRLTNSTAGGEGLVNPSKDVRARISAKISVELQGNQYRKGKPHTIESSSKISEGLKKSRKFQRAMRARRGKPGHSQGPIARAKIAIANTGRSRPDYTALLKKNAEENKGSFWVNDGTNNRLMRPGERVPRGFKRGRLMIGRPHTEEAKRKMRLARSNTTTQTGVPIYG